MWFQSTPLDVNAQPMLSPLERRRREKEDALHGKALDFCRYAIGQSSGRIEDFAAPQATFIDVRGGTYDVDDEFNYHRVLSTSHTGWDPSGLSQEFFGSTATTTITLIETAPKPNVAARKIIWSLTWQWSDRDWRVIQSHASYRKLGEFPRKHTPINW